MDLEPAALRPSPYRRPPEVAPLEAPSPAPSPAAGRAGVAPAPPAGGTEPTRGAEPARPTEASAAHARARTTADPAARHLRHGAEGRTPTTVEQDRRRLEADPTYTGLPEGTRARAGELLERHSADPAARGTLARTLTTPGFGQLSPTSQERMLTMLGGTNSDVSGPARQHLGRELERMQRLDPAAQGQRLERFLERQPHLPELVVGDGQAVGAGPARVHPFARVPRAPFESGPAPGQRGDVEIDGSRTPVVTPERSADRRYPAITREELGDALRTLPDAARRSIGELYAAPRMSRGPDGSMEYGAADEDSRRIDVYPGPDARTPGSLRATVAHEVGHTLSFQRLGKDLDLPAGQAYREAITRDRLLPSTYARDSAHEDFAETFALYMKHRGTPREQEVRQLFPARMKVIDWAIQSDPTGTVEHGGYR